MRTHLISGIEFHAAVFVVAPLIGVAALLPVSIVAGVLLLLNEVFLIYRMWLFTRVVPAARHPGRRRVYLFDQALRGFVVMQSDRPIFVIGCPRSGTTMLQLMLHSHPRIAVPPETRFLVPGYYRRFFFGDLREQRNRRRLGRWIVSERTPSSRSSSSTVTS